MKFKMVLHWIAFTGFLYFFGYASVFKVFKVPGMMQGMSAIGFDENATLLIGVAEVIGVIGLIAGIFVPFVKNVSVLFLLPFGIGAFTVHLSYHHDFSNYFASLMVCILAVVILLTDKRFKMIMGKENECTGAMTKNFS